MKVIIVGAGSLGTQFTYALVAAGHRVNLVDTDQRQLDAVRDDPAIQPVLGDACETSTLEEAGAFAADLLVAATGDDEDNLVVSLLAKRQFDVPRVAARINDADNCWLFDANWGVDVAVSSVAPLISLIEEGTGATDTVDLLRLGRAGVNLIETVIRPRSRTVDHPLRDVPLPAGTVVAAVVRDGTPTVPDAAFVLRADDEVLVVAQNAVPGDIERAFQ